MNGALGFFKMSRDRTLFHETIKVQLAHIGGLVESQLAGAIKAFDSRDPQIANLILSRASNIDAANAKLDLFIENIIETQKLTTVEARLAVTSLRMTTALNRISDMAENIAKRSLQMAQMPEAGSIKDTITRMGRIAIRQTNDAMNAMLDEDSDAAIAIWGGDDEIDSFYSAIFAEILEMVMAEHEKVEIYSQMMFVAKNFERIGDHATNIAKQVYYLKTGRHVSEPTQIVAK